MKKLLIVFGLLFYLTSTASAMQATKVTHSWEQFFTSGKTTYYVDTKHIYQRSWGGWTTGFVLEKSPTENKIYMISYVPDSEHHTDDAVEIWTEHMFNGTSFSLGGAVVHDFKANKGITGGKKRWTEEHLSKIKGFRLAVLTFFEDFMLYRIDEVNFLDKGVKVKTPNYPYIGGEIM